MGSKARPNSNSIRSGLESAAAGRRGRRRPGGCETHLKSVVRAVGIVEGLERIDDSTDLLSVEHPEVCRLDGNRPAGFQSACRRHNLFALESQVSDEDEYRLVEEIARPFVAN